MRFGHHFWNWDHEWEKDVERCIQLTRDTGWEGFEFKAPVELPPGRLKALCEEYGVECAALGGVVGASGIEETLDYARAAGVHILRAHVPVEDCARWVREAAERGIVFTIHNHIGPDGRGSGPVESAEDLFLYLEPRPGVMACPDTGHLIVCDSDPVDTLRKLGDRCAYVHLKDVDLSLCPPDRRGVGPSFVDLGEGDLDLAGCMEALEAIGYDGWVMVERDGRVEDYIESAKSMRVLLRDMGY